MVIYSFSPYNFQESKELEKSSSSYISNLESGKELDCQHYTPVSSQPSFSGGSWNSSDSKISFTSNGTLYANGFSFTTFTLFYHDDIPTIVIKQKAQNGRYHTTNVSCLFVCLFVCFCFFRLKRHPGVQ